MFWQSVLDIPYRVLIYAVSAIVMVGHVHILFWLQREIHFMYRELLKYGGSTWTVQCTLVVSTVGCITIRIVGCTTTSNVVWLTTVWDIIQTLFTR